jgi:hypothetical protein
MIKQFRRPLIFVKRYTNGINYYLNTKTIDRLKILGQFLGIILLTSVIAFTFLNNVTPFGVTVQYASEQQSENISDLVPSNRTIKEVIDGRKVFKQIDDLIYFSTLMPFQFDSATVRITYKNNNPNQTFFAGFQKEEGWNYETKPFDIPYLNELDWIRNGYDPVLYQREQKYNSVEDFTNDPPKDAIIGTAEFNTDIGDIAYTKIKGYEPQEKNTVINTPLRGKHILYVYMQNEKFNMKLYKQDLNWYKDSDIMTVKIYKGGELVHQVNVEDDGIQDDSHKVLKPQIVDIKNPGRDLPENGVYKIVIEATNDTVIRKIETNLHKIVFANSIFPVANSMVYHSIIASTSATTVYTNALNLSATTYHNQGKQNILVGDQTLGVDTLNKTTYLPPKENIAKVIVPQNDVLLTGFMGYFAFEKDQFFLPTEYHILPINKKDDIKLVDYILTDYRPAIHDGEWLVNDNYFDLSNAYIKNGRLTWVIKAPHLKENKNNITIKNIQITFHKKGWL